MEREKNDLCKLLVESNAIPKYIMGSSEYAECVINTLPKNHFRGVLDEFSANNEFCGLPIIHNIHELPNDAIVLCASLWHPILALKRLKECGVQFIDYFSLFRCCPQLSLKDISFWEGFRQSYQTKKSQYDDLYEMLADDESKDVLKRVLDFRWNYNVDAMSVFTDRQKEQYFEPFLHLDSIPYTFIDLGGFDGYTSYDFIRRCPNYSEVYFFEPVEQNITKAKQLLSGFERIHYVPYAVSDKKGVVSFSIAGSASTISNLSEGEVVVPTESVDNILNQIPPKCNNHLLVKMDIEGAEELTINGMKDTIMHHHPTLAIAAYHKGGDLIDIPAQVLRIRDDYDIYLRQYTETFIETILIFVPKVKR